MQPTLLFDLDETLISTSFRQYKLIQDFYKHKVKAIPTFDEYLLLRKNNSWSNTSFITNTIGEIELKEFKSFYLANVESQDYLSQDKLIIEVELLSKLSKYKKIIVSLRSNEQNSKWQLQYLELGKYFNEVYFLQHSTSKNPKIEVLEKLNQQNNVICFWGDSEADEVAASATSINFKYVNTGIYTIANAQHNINHLIKSYCNEI